MLSGQVKADDKEDGKKKSIQVVIAVGDDNAKAIRIEGSSPEEVHRILAEKLKDLPADVRKHVEAGLKQAKIQHGASGDRRVIVRRIEGKKSPQDKNASPKAQVKAHVIHVGDGDVKTIRIEGSSPEDVHRILQEKLKDLPADIRKRVEAAMKQAKIQHGASGDRRVIVRRIESKKSSQDKSDSPQVRVKARVIHVGDDGDAKTIRIEGSSPEDVHRILQEKLKDLPADIRKRVEAALKQAKIEHGASGERRVILRRFESKESSQDKDAAPQIRVEVHGIHVQPDGKAHRIELDLPKLHLHGSQDGAKADAHKRFVVELKLDDENSKSDRHIQLHIVGDASAIVEHDGDKKAGRHIFILKTDTEDAHGEHKHAPHEQKKVEVRFNIDGADLHGLPKEVHAKIQEALKKHGLSKGVHLKIREALEKIDLPKEAHIKIREALEKHGHGDSGKSGQHGIIILDRKGEPGTIKLKKGLHFEWLSDNNEPVIRKKLAAHAAELHKKATIAIELATAKHAEAKKVKESVREKAGNVRIRSFGDVKQGSNVEKRLDQIEGELRAIRKLLEKISKRG
jgi:uncharacterized protein YggU (UPF0235/DUF167 family)